MYVGEVKEMGEGYWVGVKMDHQVGENDGMGYFECK